MTHCARYGLPMGTPHLLCTTIRTGTEKGLPWRLQRYTIYTMTFEYDSEKSDANRKKHGIDFTAAQALWDDPDRIEIPALTTGEPRFLVLGRIDGKHWSGVITYRGENVRIISVRRSRKEEVHIYEG
ncbi:hypothetical protein AOG2_34710 [Geobacter sp. AOG2]|nr:hypothetical protein AOG2_34710 [Geobacter sp. AOG2]